MIQLVLDTPVVDFLCMPDEHGLPIGRLQVRHPNGAMLVSEFQAINAPCDDDRVAIERYFNTMREFLALKASDPLVSHAFGVFGAKLPQIWSRPEQARDRQKAERLIAAANAAAEAQNDLKQRFGPQFIEGTTEPLTAEDDRAGGTYHCLCANRLWSSKRALSREQWNALVQRSMLHEQAILGASVVDEIAQRKSIRSEVRIAVWRRDEGKCARCGSREKLEFDHIVPIALGGSNTERNLELLCETCNRSKGSQLA